VKDISDRNRGGVTLLFGIPRELNPKLPPIEQIKKDDSNNGIDPSWTKICISILKQGEGLLNLPRFMWIKKSWTLKELHLRFFDYFKDLFVRWYD